MPLKKLIILAEMIVTDRDALLCDMAETYHVYDLKALPLRTVAILASGLRDTSRIKMKLANVNFRPETVMLAMTVDRLSYLFWGLCQGGKSEHRPELLADKLIDAAEKRHSDVMTFDSPEEYERMRQRIIGEANGD